jgi:hypothetical protein
MSIVEWESHISWRDDMQMRRRHTMKPAWLLLKYRSIVYSFRALHLLTATFHLGETAQPPKVCEMHSSIKRHFDAEVP